MEWCEQGVYTITNPGLRHVPAAVANTQQQPCAASTPIVAMESRKMRWRWLLDVLVVASVVTFLALVEFGLVPNMPAGFYCGDPKISHKFSGDTITLMTLLVGTIVVPLITLWVVEACHCSGKDYDMSHPLRRSSLWGARRMWRWYREYLIGLTVVVFVTEVAKPLVGEPRPHFLETCKPDLAANCTSGYVQSYTCTNKAYSSYSLRDCTRSFPSGHASISFYMAVFLIWFIQRRVSSKVSYLLVPWLQCICLVWAMGCSFTRITDHRHHWWDVLAGGILGVATAVYTVKVFCSGFAQMSSKVVTHSPNRSSSDEGAKENGHVGSGGNRHQSVRRLLSSTSSYSGSISPDDKELKEVPVA